jgi:16S rRNA C1402 (ribose-2'-O) methylase RsmI
MLGRELTKAHQEFVRGIASEVGQAISRPRGEFTVVVGQAIKRNINNEISPSDEQVANDFWRITNSGVVSRRAAVTQVAKKYKRSAKEIYSAVERMRKLGE